MKLFLKLLVCTFMVGGLLFARADKKDVRDCQKKSQSQYYLVKNYPSDKVDNKLDRKRVHKRRRKIRKPVKGLR